MTMQLRTQDDFIQYLKDFRSWDHQGESYDAVGMMHLLGACLDNLQHNASKSDLADLSECLEAHQVAFLKLLASRL
jgi:hypothetical protein